MQTPCENYFRTVKWRLLMLVIAITLLPILLCVSLVVGAVHVPVREIGAVLCGLKTEAKYVHIILDIRLPQALTAIVAGAGLALSGAVMQSVLRNPLCSPFTLGISGAAAFGAALMLFVGGTQIALICNKLAGFSFYHDVSSVSQGISSASQSVSGFSQGVSSVSQGIIAFGAFISAALAALAILAFGRLRGSRNETIILIGVALNSLFSSGLMFLQYLSNDARLAAIVYWTFGDVSRASWNSLLIICVCLVPCSCYFLSQSWNYNALAFGEETALGLGVPVKRVRTMTMLLASLLTAVLVSLLGIIGFAGLIVPHIARLFVGSDNRFMLPFSLVFGALFLLLSDTFARILFAPHLLPVSILTSFIGVPVFLFLLLKRREQ